MTQAVKSIGRRLFARATMGVPLVLTSGGASLANQMPQGAPPIMGLAGATGMATTAKQALAEKIYQALWKRTKPDEEARSVAYVRRQMMGGLDPDLAVLNSMSHARRVQIQLDREQEAMQRHKGLRASIIRAMGGDPEDFH